MPTIIHVCTLLGRLCCRAGIQCATAAAAGERTLDRAWNDPGYPHLSFPACYTPSAGNPPLNARLRCLQLHWVGCLTAATSSEHFTSGSAIHWARAMDVGRCLSLFPDHNSMHARNPSCQLRLSCRQPHDLRGWLPWGRGLQQLRFISFSCD